MAQHPRFELFKAAWQAGDHVQALAHIDAVLADHAHVAALHWYRANCLEKLERLAETHAAVTRVLALNPDHAAALAKQVELDWAVEEAAYSEDDELTPAQYAALERRAKERQRHHIAQLRRALQLDPNLADACFGLSQLLRPGIEDIGEEAKEQANARADAEADSLLQRAIQLGPNRIAFRLVRVERLRLQAMVTDDTTPPQDCVVAYSGIRYRRAELEAALQELDICITLAGDIRYRVRRAQVLHDLGRFDEALAQYDDVLQQLPPDSPQREHVQQLRRRSEDQGAGERHDLAAMIESAIAQGDRNLADDNAATVMLGAARAVRKGKSLDEALSARLSESPDDALAANIAEQILNVAYEGPPGLIAVEAADFSPAQRKHAERQCKALQAAGQRHVAYAEAAGMTVTLGRRVLLGLYADASGATTTVTFALEPRWPGLIGFLLQFLSGKWKTHCMTECVSYFDDDAYLITQYENVSPFDYGRVVDVERLPRSTSVAALVARHAQRIADYQQAHPQARPLKGDDIASIESNWRRGQAIKRAYRRSVGYATDNELRGLLGSNYVRFVDKVKRKLQELAPDREEDDIAA